MQLRPPTPADAEAVIDVIVARDVADLGRPDYTLEDLRAEWSLPSLDLSLDAIVAEVEGRIVGYAVVQRRGSLLVTDPAATTRGWRLSCSPGARSGSAPVAPQSIGRSWPRATSPRPRCCAVVAMPPCAATGG